MVKSKMFRTTTIYKVDQPAYQREHATMKDAMLYALDQSKHNDIVEHVRIYQKTTLPHSDSTFFDEIRCAVNGRIEPPHDLTPADVGATIGSG